MQRQTIQILIGLAVHVNLCASSSHALPAFPGAEGFGTDTPGGRGGRVIAVTTLEDDGPGSLREAVTAKGPRTVVFRIGGEIRLKKHLRVTEPFITIAGQTAPGGGIMLRDAGLYVQTHDVVIRFIRSRVGPSLNEEYDTQDALQVSGEGELHHVVIDHCSFSWSIDEGVGIRNPARDVTLSWNLIAEGLRQPFTKEQIGKERSHSMGMILGGEPTRCSVHHNLIAHCNSRNPRIQGGRHAFVNNVVYDWGWLTGTFSRSPEVNFIGNSYKPGPASQDLKAICEVPGEMGRIYVQGNRSAHRPTDDMPEWDPIVNASAAQHQANEPFEMASLTIESAEDAHDAVLASAGAVLPRRDAVDARVVRDAYLSLGTKIDRPEQVGGYPEIKGGEAPADSDNDGMPDDWERAQGFDPHDPKDGPADADGDGYTNLEQYLNGLVAEGLRPRPDVASLIYGDPENPVLPVQVTAGETPLPLVQLPGSPAVYYTHAWFHDQVAVHVRSGLPGQRPLELVPARYRHRVQATTRTMDFIAHEEGPRVVELGAAPDSPRVILFLERFPADESDAPKLNVVDARGYGVTWGGSDITRRLQTALDDCAASGGGIVYVPTGEHVITSLRIPARVMLHLDRSTVVYASPDPGHEAAIVFDGVEGAGLAGPGVIDGRGSSGVRRSPLVLARNCQRLELRDAMLRDPAGPAVRLINCERVTLERIKLLTPPGRKDVGGVHIESCRSVDCNRSFITSNGDAVVVDAPSKDQAAPVRDIRLRDSVLWATVAAIRIGPETRAPISGILVQNVDAYDALRGIQMMNRHAGISDVTVRDATLRLRAIPGDSATGVPFQVLGASPDADAPIRGLLFDRVESNAANSSVFWGGGETLLRDVKLWGVRLQAEARSGRQSARDQQPLFLMRRAQDAQFRFLYVTWPDSKETSWAGVLKTVQVENLDYREKEIFERVAHSTPPAASR